MSSRWFSTVGVVLTAGSGLGSSDLNAFDNALRSAGIAEFNLIKVSSIVPSGVPVSQFRNGAPPIKGNGLMMPCIYIRLASGCNAGEVSAAVGVGLPAGDRPGVVFVNAVRDKKAVAIAGVEEMVVEGMENMGETNFAIHAVGSTLEIDKSRTGTQPRGAVIAAAAFCDREIFELFQETVEILGK